MLYFNYVPTMVWLLVFYASSSQCCGLDGSMRLWYFLVILSYFSIATKGIKIALFWIMFGLVYTIQKSDKPDHACRTPI